MADIDLKPALKLALRRRYAGNLVGLKALSEATLAEATETITITQQTFEGQASSGAITCPRATLLLVVEELIQELDTDAPRSSNASVMYFK